MEYLDLCPDCAYSDVVPTLVGFLDRSFQPHLDQMQHRSVDDPSSHRPHELGMGNTMVGRDESCG